MKRLLDHPKIFVGYICGIVAAVFWGFHPVMIRYLILQTHASPIGIADLRLLIGAAVLFVIILIRSLIRRENPWKPSFTFGKFFWVAVIGLAINFVLFHRGLEYTIASDAILLEAFAPAVVLILAFLFLPGRISHIRKDPNILPRVLLIVIAGSIGASLLIINDPKDLLVNKDAKLVGDAIEFAAMFFFAFFMVGSHEVQREQERQHPLKISAYLLFFTGILIAPFVPWKEIIHLTKFQWLLIGTLGVLSTSINYALWQVATVSLEVTPLALLFSLSSVFNVGVESIIFRLDISPKLIIGAFLILGASIVTQILSTNHKIPSP